jgi:hypothetical protein
MKRILKAGICVTLGALLITLSACSLFPGSEGDVAVYINLSAESWSDSRAPGDEADVNITPDSYKLAITYFALVDDSGGEVVIVNQEDDPADIPMVFDFSPPLGSGLLLGRKMIPRATYVGYKMRFLYIEMDMPVQFQVPAAASDSAHPYASADEDARTFRQYYNTDGSFHKRDFLVEDETGSDWYWMRRNIESAGVPFFISTADGAAHPDFNILDLFANDAFWGDMEDYDDESVLVTIESETNADAVMESFTLGLLEQLLLTVDITDTMNFKEIEGGAYEDGSLDIGPTDDTASPSTQYGDQGYHPMMPRLNLQPFTL